MNQSPLTGLCSPTIPVPPVPEGLLELPEASFRPHVFRFEAGMAFDPPLRRLSCLSGRIDGALALRLARLRRSRGFLRLGYARFGDYARERLDLAERTAYDLARLGGRLDELPALAAALREGRLGWTVAAEVARVATGDDEAGWIEKAEKLPLRKLRIEVRRALAERNVARARTASVAPGAEADGEETDGKDARPVHDPNAGIGMGTDTGNDPHAAIDTGADTGNDPHAAIDTGADTDTGNDPHAGGDTEDPPLRLQTAVRVPTAWLWDAAVDLCGQVAGSDIAPHEATAYLVADFLSGCDRGKTAPVFPEDGSASTVSASAAGPVGASGSGLDDADGKGLSRGGRAGPWPDWWDEGWIADELGQAALPETISSETRAALRLLEAPVSGDPIALDESMRTLVCSRRALDLDLARLLRQVHSLGLARHLGFPGFAAYVEARLGISPRRARFLVSLDRGLTRLPLVEAAVRRGRLGTVAARLLCRVAEAGQTEEAWLERARRVPVSRLRREVAWAEGRDRLGRERGFPAPPPRGRLTTALDQITEALTDGVWPTSALDEIPDALTDGVRPTSALDDGGPGEDRSSSGVKSSDEMGGDTTGDTDPSDRDETQPQGATATVQWPTFATREDDWVSLDLPLRRSAFPLWHEARRQVVLASGKGHATDDTVIRSLALAFLATHLPSWLQHSIAGDPIAVREGFRCAVPGCTVRGGSAHHIRFRSQGGGDEPSNLIFLCYRHHLVCLHELGSLRVTGRAPDDLWFGLGTASDGRPLEVFVSGEREKTWAA